MADRPYRRQPVDKPLGVELTNKVPVLGGGDSVRDDPVSDFPGPD